MSSLPPSGEAPIDEYRRARGSAWGLITGLQGLTTVDIDDALICRMDVGHVMPDRRDVEAAAGAPPMSRSAPAMFTHNRPQARSKN